MKTPGEAENTAVETEKNTPGTLREGPGVGVSG